MYWYIGPESKIYHTNRNCTRLHSPMRYWPITSAEEVPAGRRLCADCEWRVGLMKDAIAMLAFKPRQKVPKAEVVDRMHCSRSVALRILDELVKGGLVQECGPGSGSGVDLRLTSKGNVLRNKLTERPLGC